MTKEEKVREIKKLLGDMIIHHQEISELSHRFYIMQVDSLLAVSRARWEGVGMKKEDLDTAEKFFAKHGLWWEMGYTQAEYDEARRKYPDAETIGDVGNYAMAEKAVAILAAQGKL